MRVRIAWGAFAAMAAVLVGALVLQLALAAREGPGEPRARTMAVWRNLASSLAEAKQLADLVILGEVVNLQPGPPLVTDLPDEPADPPGQEEIPIEVVSLQIQAVYIGSTTSPVPVFHTLPVGTDTSDLEDDPAYLLGERYVLFLTEGPTVSGNPTRAIIAPEGRYRVGPGDILEPVTGRGFAPTMAGKTLAEFEAELSQAAVGGIAERVVEGSDSPASAGGGSGLSTGVYAAIAAGVAAAAVAAAGGWYARRRWTR